LITQMNRNDALMWLNDRQGKNVKVVLSVDRGGWSIYPIELEGALKHTSTPGLTAEHGEELAGTYKVGYDGGLDLTELPDDAFSLRQTGSRYEELRVSVGEHAGIGITAPVDS
jgi:hypothetical protein